MSLVLQTNTINSQFALQKETDIAQYFPKNKDFRSILISKINRTVHFFQTGIWINKASVLNFAINHAEIAKYLTNRPIHHKVVQYSHKIFVPTVSVWQKMKDGIQFLHRFIQSPGTVGSLAPSSDRLAKAIVRQIPKASMQKRCILEVGPGTGVFTDKLIKRLNPHDELHLVEFDSKFCALLREKYKHIPNVKIFEGDILNHMPQNETGNEIKYDFIVSGLPLNAFSPDFVGNVFNKYEKLSKQGTMISYFEYMFIPQIIKIFSSAKKYAPLGQVLEKKDAFYNKHKYSIDRVWLNITPAQVRNHKIQLDSAKV